jgi:protein tyrosine/serine phosphatase
MAAGGWALGLHVMGNIHVVEPNTLYRSAQLTGPELEAVIGQYGIRTIINLRGDNKGSSWYDDEIATSEKRSVTHVDVRMSARSEPSPSTLNDLISAMRVAPRPILIHCKDGADRTGLAAAIYELLIVGRGSDAAGRQLSFRYGHFPWLGSSTSAMDQAFESLIAETKLVAPAGAQ